jgi:acetyltransferase
MEIERLDADRLPAVVDELAELLKGAVEDGASLGYLAPMSIDAAREHWRSLQADVRDGTRVVLVARDGDRVVGSGQIRFETKENGRHRAEIVKVMVAASHRRRGIGRAVMAELENAAADAGIALLYLDTSDGPGGARELYEALGWSHAGGIPGFALDPDGTPADNLIYYKWLADPPVGPRSG